MKKSFNFEDAGRTYACRVEAARNAHAPAWWWFSVSNDSQRYAPFCSDASDTEDSVRSRIIAFYENRLARRDAPREPWRRTDKPASPPSTAPDPSAAAPVASDRPDPDSHNDGQPS